MSHLLTKNQIIKQLNQRIKKSGIEKLILQIIFFYVKDKEKRKLAKQLIGSAGRYELLLDNYYETKNRKFYQMAMTFGRKFHVILNKQHLSRIKKIEKTTFVLLYNKEQNIRKKIRKGSAFSKKELMKYWKLKSKDAFFISSLIKLFALKWNLSKAFYIFLLLHDLKKDISDYENDLRNNLPNIFYFFLSRHVTKNLMPNTNKDMMKLVQKLSIAKEILFIAKKLFYDTKRYNLKITCPPLNRAIKMRYKTLLSKLS